MALSLFILLLVAIVVFVLILQRSDKAPTANTELPSRPVALRPQPSRRRSSPQSKQAELQDATITRKSGTADLSMLPKNFVVLDLETTGLSYCQNEIIEIGALRVNLDSTTHATYQTLVKPTKKVPKRIAKLTGITQAMVEAEGLNLEEALSGLMDFIQDLPLVTFNASFDMGFLNFAAERHGIVINNRYVCALQLARRAWPGLPSYRLTDLARRGNLSVENSHRALGDSVCAAIIFTSAASTLGCDIPWRTPQIRIH